MRTAHGEQQQQLEDQGGREVKPEREKDGGEAEIGREEDGGETDPSERRTTARWIPDAWRMAVRQARTTARCRRATARSRHLRAVSGPAAQPMSRHDTACKFNRA